MACLADFHYVVRRTVKLHQGVQREGESGSADNVRALSGHVWMVLLLKPFRYSSLLIQCLFFSLLCSSFNFTHFFSSFTFLFFASILFLIFPLFSSPLFLLILPFVQFVLLYQQRVNTAKCTFVRNYNFNLFSLQRNLDGGFVPPIN